MKMKCRFFELASFCIFAFNILPGVYMDLQCYNGTQTLNCTNTANNSACVTHLKFQNTTITQTMQMCDFTNNSICNSSGCVAIFDTTTNNTVTTCQNCCTTNLCNSMKSITDFLPPTQTTKSPLISDAAKPVAGLLLWLVFAPFILKNLMN